jgi:hypothetical protein
LQILVEENKNIIGQSTYVQVLDVIVGLYSEKFRVILPLNSLTSEFKVPLTYYLSVNIFEKFGIRQIPRLGTRRLKNEIRHVPYQTKTIGQTGILYKCIKRIRQKGKNKPSEPKKGIWAPKSI